MRAIIRTKWSDREGGFWTATAYTEDGNHRIRYMEATGVEERATVGQVVGDLIAAGYTWVSCESQLPIWCTVDAIDWKSNDQDPD